MFDVGLWELLLILGVGLLILGPERMPRVASQLGRWIGRARRTASSLRRQLEQEIASADAPPPPPKRKPTPVKPVNRPVTAEQKASSAADEPQTPAAGSAAGSAAAPAQGLQRAQDHDDSADGS